MINGFSAGILFLVRRVFPRPRPFRAFSLAGPFRLLPSRVFRLLKVLFFSCLHGLFGPAPAFCRDFSIVPGGLWPVVLRLSSPCVLLSRTVSPGVPGPVPVLLPWLFGCPREVFSLFLRLSFRTIFPGCPFLFAVPSPPFSAGTFPASLPLGLLPARERLFLPTASRNGCFSFPAFPGSFPFGFFPFGFFPFGSFPVQGPLASPGHSFSGFPVFCFFLPVFFSPLFPGRFLGYPSAP